MQFLEWFSGNLWEGATLLAFVLACLTVAARFIAKMFDPESAKSERAVAEIEAKAKADASFLEAQSLADERKAKAQLLIAQASQIQAGQNAAAAIKAKLASNKPLDAAQLVKAFGVTVGTASKKKGIVKFYFSGRDDGLFDWAIEAEGGGK